MSLPTLPNVLKKTRHPMNRVENMKPRFPLGLKIQLWDNLALFSLVPINQTRNVTTLRNQMQNSYDQTEYV